MKNVGTTYWVTGIFFSEPKASVINCSTLFTGHIETEHDTGAFHDEIGHSLIGNVLFKEIDGREKLSFTKTYREGPAQKIEYALLSQKEQGGTQEWIGQWKWKYEDKGGMVKLWTIEVSEKDYFPKDLVQQLAQITPEGHDLFSHLPRLDTRRI